VSVSVVIPTIAGREALLEQTRKAYEANTSVAVQFIVVRNRPTCGDAWNAGAAVADSDYLHLSADDVLPHEGWFDAAKEAADGGCYPAPRIVRPDGSLEACGSMGGGMLLPECPDKTPCRVSSFPFMRTRDWEHIGPSLPIGYYADDFLSYRAHRHGFEVVVKRDYCLTHLEGLVGRQTLVDRAMQDCNTYLEAVCAS
jgi:GT2 family glycosyltransferase